MTENTDIPLFTKKDMIQFRTSKITLYEYAESKRRAIDKNISLKGIYEICCYACGVKMLAASIKNRKREFVLARQSAHYFSALLTDRTVTNIGTSIGRKHYATVLHSIKTIRNVLDVTELGGKDERQKTIELIAGRLGAKYRVDIYELMEQDRTDEKMRHMRW